MPGAPSMPMPPMPMPPQNLSMPVPPMQVGSMPMPPMPMPPMQAPVMGGMPPVPAQTQQPYKLAPKRPPQSLDEVMQNLGQKGQEKLAQQKKK